MTVYLKINALVPSERDKPCCHKCVRWNGRIPCTGRVLCSMCGTSWSNMTAAQQAQQEARDA